jgi:F-type H+-transporting ATPase subunit a
MAFKHLKWLRIAAFGLIVLFFSTVAIAQHEGENHAAATDTAASTHEAASEDFKPGDIIMEHIMDNHDFHLFDWNGHPVSLPLPVIVYSKENGFAMFMSSKFEHGHAAYKGYKLEHGHVKAVSADGAIIENAAVYDFSITRNVAGMLLSLTILVVLVIGVAKKYKTNGVHKAPTGFQNALEPVITFIRDEVGKSNLGNKYEKYMPYLLTVFFFILICNLFGLIPGAANITGNIAFTVVLGVISFVAILLSTNSHFWAHIFNPPVPGFVKPILIIVEFLGVFTKPFALIIRLFANMVAGHMIITCLVMMIFIFSKISVFAGVGFAPVSLAFTIFIYIIEVLVAFIQAFIFTNLTAVFISQAFEGEHHAEEGAHHH